MVLQICTHIQQLLISLSQTKKLVKIDFILNIPISIIKFVENSLKSNGNFNAFQFHVHLDAGTENLMLLKIKSNLT